MNSDPVTRSGCVRHRDQLRAVEHCEQWRLQLCQQVVHEKIGLTPLYSANLQLLRFVVDLFHNLLYNQLYNKSTTCKKSTAKPQPVVQRRPPHTLQEIWANPHETRDSISLLSYAGCLGLYLVISVKIHSLNVRRSLKSRKIYQFTIFRFQRRSTSSMLVPRESSPAVLVMIRSKSVSICNRSHAITS